MNTAYLSIGSNLGDRLAILQEAVRALDSNEKMDVTSVSAVYETEPVGYTEQPNFLNIVVELQTSLDPFELLAACQSIEQSLGRVRDIRWGPRTADLDILLYNNETIVSENLTVPHPRMHERAFVLIPLLELNPDVKHPVTGKHYREEPAAKEDGVVLYRGFNGVASFWGMK
ncbi:MAG TPA: 2-amino-4-hydroxy-6-hydroxymethyldihydropteridine diphosphokinase [Sporosarcina sp.]|nr:2-amino-4-hydroxy-6-hydroxymethyldihydropteridine diphosphokinase [Sporosarcina sp.]